MHTYTKTNWVAGTTKTTAAQMNRIENGIANAYTDIEELYSEISDVESTVSTGKTTVATAITNQGVSTKATDSFDTMATNIGTVATNKYNAGKADFNPTAASITNAGVLTLKNAAGTALSYKPTLTPNYNGGYSAGQTDYAPVDGKTTLTDAGVLTVGNSAGTTRLTKTFDNSYNKGYSTGQTDYAPVNGKTTLTDAGVLTVGNSAGTTRLTKTFDNSYNKGYSAGTTNGKSLKAQIGWNGVSISAGGNEEKYSVPNMTGGRASVSSTNRLTIKNVGTTAITFYCWWRYTDNYSGTGFGHYFKKNGEVVKNVGGVGQGFQYFTVTAKDGDYFQISLAGSGWPSYVGSSATDYLVMVPAS